MTQNTMTFNNKKDDREEYRKYIKEWIKNNPEKQKQYYRIYKYYSNLTNPIIKECIVCGKKFETRQYHKKYCSIGCKKKMHNLKKDYKRRKKGFYLMIPNVFPSNIAVDMHHIHPNLPFVVPLPRKLHQENNGNLIEHLNTANEWVEFYYNIDVNKFLNLGGANK